MNWDLVLNKWKDLRSAVKTRWSKLTEADLDSIGGRREQLLNRLEERYGIESEEAKRRADEWVRFFRDELRNSRPVRHGA